ncbi:MAG: hypothetical protein ACJ74U_04640 [Jatrophihabitantaceae bacterium]
MERAAESHSHNTPHRVVPPSIDRSAGEFGRVQDFLKVTEGLMPHVLPTWAADVTSTTRSFQLSLSAARNAVSRSVRTSTMRRSRSLITWRWACTTTVSGGDRSAGDQRRLRLADAEGAFIAEPGADGWVLAAVGGSMFFKRRMFGSTASN